MHAAPRHEAPPGRARPATLIRNLRDMIDRAPFGATGHESSRVIFGAAALGDVSKADADRTLECSSSTASTTSTSPPAMAMRSCASPLAQGAPEFFLATKTGERTYAAAREEIRRSLERLGVDHVDSIQLHNLCDVIEWDMALSPGGALEACLEARDEGLVRFIGVTGHGLSIPKMHQRSLERFDFDSVLCPYNWVQMQDPRYAATFEALAEMCEERNVALQTIKSLASSPGGPRNRPTWYEPLRSGRHRPRGQLGAGPARRSSCSPPATSTCCRSCSTPPSAPGSAPDEQMSRLELAPLFT